MDADRRVHGDRGRRRHRFDERRRCGSSRGSHANSSVARHAARRPSRGRRRPEPPVHAMRSRGGARPGGGPAMRSVRNAPGGRSERCGTPAAATTSDGERGEDDEGDGRGRGSTVAAGARGRSERVIGLADRPPSDDGVGIGGRAIRTARSAADAGAPPARTASKEAAAPRERGDGAAARHANVVRVVPSAIPRPAATMRPNPRRSVLRETSWRAMVMRWISLVPSPMHRSGASR